MAPSKWPRQNIADSVSEQYPGDLAADTNGNVYVAYAYGSPRTLRYAKYDGSSWGSPETVDSSGATPFAISLLVDSSGDVHIVYWDSSTENAKHAVLSGGTWSVTTIDSNSVKRMSSVRENSSGDLKVVISDTFEIRIATYTSGSWSVSTVHSSSSYLDIEMDLDGNDNPHVMHRNKSSELERTYFDGSNWQNEIVDTDSSFGMGSAPSIIVDSGGTLHVLHENNSQDDLRYAVNDGGGWSITAEAVNNHVVPYIIEESGGTIRALAIDILHGECSILTLSSGTWSIETVDTDSLVASSHEVGITEDSAGLLHVLYKDDNSKLAMHAWSETIARASASKTKVTTSESISFDGTDSFAPLESITAYSWDFGDGNAGSGSAVSYSYDNSGTYTVTLTVTDDSNNTDAATLTIEVTNKIASISVSSASLVQPLGAI